jgi:hypothetical protein
MFIGIQIALVVVGLFIMSRGRFAIGDREVGNPLASLIGIVLTAQLPLALLAGIALGLTENTPPTTAVPIPTRAGQPVQFKNVPVSESADTNWWVDPLITCGSVLVAAGLAGIALRAGNDTEDAFASLRTAEPDAAP